MTTSKPRVSAGTKIEHIDPDGEHESDYGEVVAERAEGVDVKWFASGMEGQIALDEIGDLVVDDWNVSFWVRELGRRGEGNEE